MLRQFLKLVPFALVLVPSLASAHPHVWVEMRTGIAFTDDGKISGVNVEWSFDDAYAAVALEGMDANGDGDYSPEELVALTTENMDSLKDYNYFNKMWGGDAVLETAPPTLAGQSYTDKKLKLHFTVPLVVPYDPRSAEFKLKIFDPEFYIAFDYVKDAPVKSEGKIAAECKFELKPLPTDAELNATQEMLATKGVDWKPENGEDFGSMFAQALVVICES